MASARGLVVPASEVKHLGEIERGRGNPTLKNLESLANVLGIELSELFDFGEVEKSEDDLRAELVAQLKEIDATTLKILYRALRP
ncbi:helix-turn-helix transcriptional regulator [Deltaproteobacteria bacterium OttesenSCG-928-M10]|nr:helix-turn-helix transcriptional regulator [Deltaproteobacteria bacterium OttesenSCG-928-M10]